MSSCLLDYDNKGNVVVRGENSSLFNSVLSRTGNEEQAIKIWSVSISDDFKLSGMSPTESEVNKFIELQTRVESKPFIKDDAVEAINSSLGIENFQERFDKAFMNEEGEFELDFNRLFDSGLYTADEIENMFLHPEQIKETWLRQKNQTIPQIEGNFPVVAEEGTTMFGMSRRVNPDKIVSDIVKGEEYEGVSEEMVNEIRGEKVAVQQFVLNPLTDTLEKKVYDNTYYKLLHGIPAEADTSKLNEVLDLIISIPGADFISQANNVKELFRILDIEAGKIGIDLVGIDKKFNVLPTAEVMNMLVAVRAISEDVSSVTEEDIQLLANTMDSVFGNQEYNDVFITEKLSQPKSVVRIKTNNRERMFSEFGLVKIKDGFYRKVNKNADAFELAYNNAKNNIKNIFGEQFPTDKRNSITYKEKFFQRMEEFTNKRISEYPNIPLEEAKKLIILEELYKEADNMEKEASLMKFKRLSQKNNIKILEEGNGAIISKIIDAKRKGNPLPLAVSQLGVELVYEGEYTLETLQDEQITDVLAINGELDGVLARKDFIDDVPMQEFERNYYLNNPHKLEEFRGNVEEFGTTIVATSKSPFIKVGGEIYEKVDENVFEWLENDGLSRWDRKAPTQSYFPKKENITQMEKPKKYVASPKKNNGVYLHNPLLNNPHLTEEEAEKAYKNVYSDDLLKTEC